MGDNPSNFRAIIGGLLERCPGMPPFNSAGGRRICPDGEGGAVVCIVYPPRRKSKYPPARGQRRPLQFQPEVGPSLAQPRENVESMAGSMAIRAAKRTASVKRVDSWACMDMHGNTWEWCANFLRPGLLPKNVAAKRPTGRCIGLESRDTGRRFFGWFWRNCRSGYRYGSSTGQGAAGLGMRVLLEAADGAKDASSAPAEGLFCSPARFPGTRKTASVGGDGGEPFEDDNCGEFVDRTERNDDEEVLGRTVVDWLKPIYQNGKGERLPGRLRGGRIFRHTRLALIQSRATPSPESERSGAIALRDSACVIDAEWQEARRGRFI